MWALNHMKHRARVEYAVGRRSTRSRTEDDDVYEPHQPLVAVGPRVILLAPVVHCLIGDGWRGARIAIAKYRNRIAIAEMSSDAEIKKSKQHKDAGMEITAVSTSFPIEGEPVPAQVSAVDDDQLLPLHVVDEIARSLSDPSGAVL